MAGEELRGQFEESVLLEGTIGRDDIAGYQVRATNHGYDGGGRLEMYVMVPQDIIDGMRTAWEHKHLNDPEFFNDIDNLDPPQFNQFYEDVAERLEAQGIDVVGGVGLSAARGATLSGAEEAHFNDWSGGDGRFLAVGNPAENPDMAEFEPDAGWQEVSVMRLFINDDGTLPIEEQAEVVRQGFYQGVLGYQPEAVPTINYGPEPAALVPEMAQ